MGKLAVVFALIIGFYPKIKSLLVTEKVPVVHLIDSTGNKINMSTTLSRPMIVGFWINNCGYSDRILKIMSKLRNSYPAGSLDIVGVYLNPIDDPALNESKKTKYINFPVAQGQRDVQVIAQLHNSFKLRGAGSDIYVVDKKGRIFSVLADSKEKGSGKAIESELLKIINKKTGLKQIAQAPVMQSH